VSPTETRDAAIGATSEMLTLYVVYVEREETMIRIISAREAEPSQRRRDENGE
jgi:uncharacterized DUF497 family protein